MKLKYYIILLCIIGCEGCTSTISVDFEPLPDKAVLNSTLYPDSLITAHISHSIAPGENISKAFIDDAEVEVFINGISKGYMNKIGSSGQYILPDVYPVAGDRIRMEAHTRNYDPITSEIIFPSDVKILSVDTFLVTNIEDRAQKDLQIYIRFKDPANVKNHYMFTAFWEVKEIRYEKERLYTYPAYLNLKEEFLFENNNNLINGWDSGETNYKGIFTDDQINGQEYTLKVINEKTLSLYDEDSVTSIRKLVLNLYSVSQSFYSYQLSLLRKQEAEINFGESGLKEPVQLYSNIDNGYGLFSGIQLSTYKIILPEDKNE